MSFAQIIDRIIETGILADSTRDRELIDLRKRTSEMIEIEIDPIFEATLLEEAMLL